MRTTQALEGRTVMVQSLQASDEPLSERDLQMSASPQLSVESAPTIDRGY